MKKHLIISLFFLLLPVFCRSQVSGLSTLSVLDVSSSARTAALGMDFLSIWDNDDRLIGIDNPSFLTDSYHNSISLNYVALFSGANFGAVSYGRSFNKVGNFLVGLHFNSYGRFDGYDENEVSEGKFFAADYALSFGWGRPIDSNFFIGVNFKPLLSQYETYTAFAFALDVAGSYVSTSRRFSTTLIARNSGAQLATFNGNVESLPFELALGLSYRLENAPFRFFFTAADLQKWNLRYEDPLNPIVTYDPYTGTYSKETWAHEAFDKLFRHAIIGVELSLKNAFFARVGFNYRQMKETAGVSNFNTSGFSYGFGIRKKRFDFGFARNNYYLGKAPNYITLSLRF